MTVAEIVQDRFHGLAQRRPGIRGDACDLTPDSPVVLTATTKDFTAMVVRPEHRQTHVQLTRACNDLVQHRFQDLNSSNLGPVGPLSVVGIIEQPVQVVSVIPSALPVIRIDQIYVGRPGPMAVERTGVVPAVPAHVVGGTGIEGTRIPGVRVVGRMIDGGIHGTRVVRHDHDVGAVAGLFDEQRNLAGFIGGQRRR